MKMYLNISLTILFLTMSKASAQTIALWLFDEPLGLYPSHVMDDQSDNDHPLVLGLGGKLVKGKFGNALSTQKHAKIVLPEGEARFGLSPVPKADGRTVEPMTWMNSNFCALMTSGENHLRKEVGFINATDSKLNLGDFNWTVEFWFQAASDKMQGCVFEIGKGPRGENNMVTSLFLSKGRDTFILKNVPSNTELLIKTDPNKLNNASTWHHLAFTYSSSAKTINHYVDGILQDTKKVNPLKALPRGEEAYMSIGRDGSWNLPLPGAMDELRFSEGIIYEGNFNVPQSFSPEAQGLNPKVELKIGPPLLFSEKKKDGPLQLMNRKYLFIDNALLLDSKDLKFNVNPPKRAERVIDHIEGPYRKHLTVVEDEQGLIRIYNSIHDDYLAVRTSKDGINFNIPDMGNEYRGQKNIVLQEMVGGLGNPFIDVNGPPGRRWKYISGYHRRGIYVYTSPDGYDWTRNKTALLPFRSGTQSCTFYDDQRQLYVGYHRTGIFHTPAGATQRGSVLTETNNLYVPIAFKPLSQQDYLKADKKMRLRDPLPWYLDNGPLTPGGFGIEFPHKFDPIEADPVGTDIYITKAQKYPWAPDTYLAFPIVYFHYEKDGPPTRHILMHPDLGRGSGPVETQISVSRDGVNWQRFSRPTYVGIGQHAGRNVYTAYIAHGMVRRGDEIWQYYFGESQYHSAHKRDEAGRAVYRLVQRLDGFVSMDAPYDKEVTVISKPLVFKGNRLVLNIDTDATGYAQVGFLDENGQPIRGFGVDDCVYINGDFVETEVEWFPNWGDFTEFEGKNFEDIENTKKDIKLIKDLSSIEGKTVQVVFRLRGCKLFALQFVER
jgi:hypothetical protein